MIISENILRALRDAVEAAGNPYRFSLKLKSIGQPSVRAWLRGERQSISDSNWEILKPHLQAYLGAKYNEVKPSESLEMTALLREKISVLEERLKLATENIAAKSTIIKDKNKRINELEISSAALHRQIRRLEQTLSGGKEE